ncbi:MAG: hypothetical protein ABIQ38_03105 [Ilumatobacteraceae bacterium]
MTVVTGVLVDTWAGVLAGVLPAGVLAGLELVSDELEESGLATESPLLVDSLPAEVGVVGALVDEDFVRLSVL